MSNPDRTTPAERHLRETLRAIDPPGAASAEQRAWSSVSQAFAERDRAHRRRPPALRVALAVATVAAIVAVALTPPGDAVADWVKDVVAPRTSDAPPAPPPAPAIALPGDAPLLASSPAGTWIVRGGTRRKLGPYPAAIWSPRGRFVLAERRRGLNAMHPDGDPAWSVTTRAPIHGAAWSPEGFHIVYIAGHTLRVVGGDGQGDQLIHRGTRRRPATDVASVTPAFRPGAPRTVAYARRDGVVEVIEVFSGGLLRRSAPGVGRDATKLVWSGDGRTLAVLAQDRVTFWDVARDRTHTVRLGPSRIGAALAVSGNRFMLAQHDPRRHVTEITSVSAASGTGASLLELRGVVTQLTFSPGGRWLLATWPHADQWVLLRLNGARPAVASEVAAVRGLRRAFGGHTPVPQGWGPPAAPAP